MGPVQNKIVRTKFCSKSCLLDPASNLIKDHLDNILHTHILVNSHKNLLTDPRKLVKNN